MAITGTIFCRKYIQASGLDCKVVAIVKHASEVQKLLQLGVPSFHLDDGWKGIKACRLDNSFLTKGQPTAFTLFRRQSKWLRSVLARDLQITIWVLKSITAHSNEILTEICYSD